MPFRGRARGRARLPDAESAPVGPPPPRPPSEVENVLRRLAAVRVAEPAAASGDVGAAAAAPEDAGAVAADLSRPSSREAAPEVGAVSPEGGAIPKRHDQGAASVRGAAGGRSSSYIDQVIFGGYSRDNKKDFMVMKRTCLSHTFHLRNDPCVHFHPARRRRLNQF